MNKNTFYQAIQISTLPLFTDKQIFDFVAENLLKQGCKSVIKEKLSMFQEKEESCMYRGENGAKCAFGFLMADSEYKQEFENMMSRRVLGFYFEEIDNLLGDKTIDLISSLQNIHDNHPVSDWREALSQNRFQYLT